MNEQPLLALLFKKALFIFIFKCVSAYRHICLCSTYIQCPRRSEDSLGCHRAEGTGNCECPYDCREPNSVEVLCRNRKHSLTTEPSLQPIQPHMYLFTQPFISLGQKEGQTYVFIFVESQIMAAVTEGSSLRVQSFLW